MVWTSPFSSLVSVSASSQRSLSPSPSWIPKLRAVLFCRTCCSGGSPGCFFYRHQCLISEIQASNGRGKSGTWCFLCVLQLSRKQKRCGLMSQLVMMYLIVSIQKKGMGASYPEYPAIQKLECGFHKQGRLNSLSPERKTSLNAQVQRKNRL